MTIELKSAIDLNGGKQIEEALIVLNTEGYEDKTGGTKSNTTIRIVNGHSTVNIHSKYKTKFESIEDWNSDLNNNTKIYLNYESESRNSNFVIIVCSHSNNSEKQNRQYLINTNDIAFIQIKFKDKIA